MGDKEPQTTATVSISFHKEITKGVEERQPGVKSYHAEQMDFRVLRGREEETRDVSVPRLSLLLKITGRETESQFWNRKLGSFF